MMGWWRWEMVSSRLHGGVFLGSDYSPRVLLNAKVEWFTQPQLYWLWECRIHISTQCVKFCAMT